MSKYKGIISLTAACDYCGNTMSEHDNEGNCRLNEDLQARREAYADKVERRRDRLDGAAESAEAKSQAHYKASDAAIAGIPTGQPILVGHHSEKGHRRAIERCHNHMDKFVEESAKAEEYRGRAHSVGKGGISSDDPDAVVKLKAKLAKLEEERDHMKRANKAYKLAVKLNVEDAFAERPLILATISKAVGLPVDSELLRKAVSWKPQYSFEKGPFVGWPLTNLGANIRTVKARIEELSTAAEQEPAPDRMVGEVRIVENVEENRIQVFFPAKPSDEVRTKLKRYGFRWSRYEGAWQRHLNNAGRHAVEQVIG